MPPLPTRSTLVLREEGAYWKVVRWHLSVPVAGKEALGIELTTSVNAILAMVENDASPIAATSAKDEVTIVFTDLEGTSSINPFSSAAFPLRQMVASRDWQCRTSPRGPGSSPFNAPTPAASSNIRLGAARAFKRATRSTFLVPMRSSYEIR